MKAFTIIKHRAYHTWTIFLMWGHLNVDKSVRTIEYIMYNQRKFVDNTIAEGKECKQELLSELGSMRSGSQTSSISSAVLWARARAKAAAAVKKAEIQKKRSVLEAQSALVIQKEKARIEQLCLEEEAAIAIAKANAIDNELGFKSGSQQLDLPEETLVIE